MQPSENAYTLIKHFEGLRLRSYKDIGGTWTIGYGHTRNVWAGMSIDEDEADYLLFEDINEAAYEVSKLLTVEVSQQEFDALTSWVFNLGSDLVRKSTLLRKLNALEDSAKVAREFEKWCKYTEPSTGEKETSQGLLRRRRAERRLFETGELVFE